VVNGTILPFPAAAGVKTPPRPPSPTPASREDFAGAMDDALDARSTRRAGSGSRPAARRTDPTRPREAAEKDVAAPARNASSAKPARKADRADAAGDDTSVEREPEASATDVAAAPDQSDTTPEESKSGGDAAAGDPAAGDPAAEELAATAVICDAALPGEDEGEADADADDGEDALARGRRWDTPATGQANEHSETAPNGAAHRAGGTPGAGLKLGHAIQQVRADANATPGDALAQIAQDVVAAAHADAGVAEVATNEPVTEAVDTAAAKSQTASAAAATAIENAASALETVAAVEASADAGTDGSGTQEQAQPKPQAPGAHANAAATVAVGGSEGGVKFTVNSAAGSAAYTNAAPRSEEAVLPQIVQSIRLHAVQGTTEARVQLKPEHLGNLHITLKVEQNQVTATIQADVAAVRQWIESHEASLRQSLSEQGLHLAKLVVHEDEQQTSKDEQGGDRPRRQPRRRSWRDQEPTFEVLV
jgi:flagellar hook-length control protein FliK